MTEKEKQLPLIKRWLVCHTAWGIQLDEPGKEPFGMQRLLLGSMQAGGEPAGEGGDLPVRRHWVARPQPLLWDLHKTGNPGR